MNNPSMHFPLTESSVTWGTLLRLRRDSTALLLYSLSSLWYNKFQEDVSVEEQHNRGIMIVTRVELCTVVYVTCVCHSLTAFAEQIKRSVVNMTATLVWCDGCLMSLMWLQTRRIRWNSSAVSVQESNEGNSCSYSYSIRRHEECLWISVSVLRLSLEDEGREQRESPLLPRNHCRQDYQNKRNRRDSHQETHSELLRTKRGTSRVMKPFKESIVYRMQRI